MNSGLDTESIVQQLVAAKQIKVDDLKNDQKKLEWKQTAWQDLNSKIYSLYSGTLSKLRMSGAFNKQKTTISDSTKATVTANGAPNGSQTLKVKQIAKTGYLTGKRLDEDGLKRKSSNEIAGISDQLTGQKIKITATTTLQEGDKYKLDKDGNAVKATPEDLFEEKAGTLRLQTAQGGEEVKLATEITFEKDMKISDFVTKLREAGVNANFDEENQRFFISAKKAGEDNDFTIENLSGGNALELLGLDTDKGASRIDGENAKIELNGSEFTSTSNTFNINGLTINAMAATADGEELLINTSSDVNAVYDTIKDFLTEYNELINEMDKLYNADSARKYNMLSADEKASMTDEEVEKWEDTIKGALLRKDTQLGSVMNTMTQAMLKTFEINGKTVGLSTFGIKTLGYFTAKDNERHAYHIDGDEDDENTSGEEDKLLKALTEDPESAIEFFSSLCKNLYGELDKTMSTSTDYSSMYKVYNDKQLKKDYDNYTKKIKEAEDKLSAYEDKWYDKFSKMETALAKLQSNQSIVSSMLGSN